MLDYFCIFTKGGALLWAFQMATALKGTPINALIRTCLLEERSGESSFTYTPPSGAPYTLKWTMHNGLGLVFVAVYQKALKLMYVDELLERAKAEFAPMYKPGFGSGAARYGDHFEQQFKQLLRQAENQAEAAARRPPPSANGVGGRSAGMQGGGHKHGAANGRSKNNRKGGGESEEDTSGSSDGGPQGAAAAGHGAHRVAAANGALTATSESDGGSSEESAGGSRAFNQAALTKKLTAKRGPPGARSARHADPGLKPRKEGGTGAISSKSKSRGARKWGGAAAAAQLDFSADTGADGDGGSKAAHGVDYKQLSRVDVEETYSSEEEDEGLEEADGHVNQKGGGKQKGGVLASFVRNLGVSVVGTGALTREDIQPALEAMKRKLMERNVAEEIAEKLCESVAAGVVGQKLGSFTRVSSVVSEAVEAALTRILTPKRSTDVLREARAAKAAGRPYVVVFVGVNGVGKSTNLAKVAFWLQQNDVSVMIAACDTFRSGAVEQLKTHCSRLDVPLYERGYEKDPAKVAAEAVRAAAVSKRDVVLVDTAGRMQDNEPLMRALSNLIHVNQPDLVLFVGEALVGNDAVDQLTKFNQRLADLAAAGGKGSGGGGVIDGIVLTKFDTIDDKVGAALSMVYTSGAPIMFVGCGQTYVDLKRLNVKQVVRSLLK